MATANNATTRIFFTMLIKTTPWNGYPQPISSGRVLLRANAQKKRPWGQNRSTPIALLRYTSPGDSGASWQVQPNQVGFPVRLTKENRLN
jgi:hypothetical protein